MAAIILETDTTLDTLNGDSTCLQCLSDSQIKIAQIWFMAQLLKLAGGADYTALADLTAAAKCFKCVPDKTLDAFDAATWAAAAASAGLPEATLAAFMEAIKCWMCLDPKTVRAAFTLLLNLLSKEITVIT